MTRFKRLRFIPFNVDPKRRVNCLIDIASQFYHQGQSTFDGVEPAALAVMLARDIDDRALLRKALTVQAVILFSTNNPGDALTALSEASKSLRRSTIIGQSCCLEQSGRRVL